VPPPILSSGDWRCSVLNDAVAVQGTADLDHHRLRESYRTRREPEPIELGNEPPLSVDGGEGGLIDRRRVSLQWFSGTILTGLCGAALMGGAVFAALDGETNFAAVPERVEAALRGAFGAGDRTGARKADRLPPVLEPNVSRQIIRVSTTSRSGDRELVRVRPFVRVTGNLALSVTELSANIPRFNPARLLADPAPGSGVAAEEAPGAAPDAEVSFVTRELAAVLPRAKIALALSTEDVMARVRQTANWTGPKPATYAVASIDPSMRLAYAAEGPSDLYAGFEARIVPENITLLPKTTTQTTGGNTWNERAIVAKKGDSITSILRELGATSDEAKAIAGVLGTRGRDGGLREGQKLRILLAPSGKTQRMQPIRVIVAAENAVEAVVALSDMGKYVSVDVQSINTTTEVAEAVEEEDDGSGVRLYQSVYETALRNQVPRLVVEDLVRIYSYDVDFQRKVQPGDSFEVLYTGEDDAPAPDARTDVLFASLTVGGETKKFYRFASPDDGVVDYYDETGKSAKKFLVRKPVGAGIMRSGFGVRRHPILGYMKMHTGVDWTAPHGTPIYASGNGVIDRVGWESGYGKYVRIRHNNGYETAYGHMTAFARGIEQGVRVRQGQVIGFVGSTGLSTGSHLHYEILVNGRFVDPMRIRLPRGRVLDGPVLANFEKERERLDGMMARAPARMAQTTGAR
jgi:murein DD-endopeptidase MepM/ murein hydrolase activator NlpD